MYPPNTSKKDDGFSNCLGPPWQSQSTSLNAELKVVALWTDWCHRDESPNTSSGGGGGVPCCFVGCVWTLEFWETFSSRAHMYSHPLFWFCKLNTRMSSSSLDGDFTLCCIQRLNFNSKISFYLISPGYPPRFWNYSQASSRLILS